MSAGLARFSVLGQHFSIPCSPDEARRLEDLAASLNGRLANLAAQEKDPARRLVLVALGLLDDVQGSGAALLRARREIERLGDIINKACLDSAPGKML